jgi:hypothetical protein
MGIIRFRISDFGFRIGKLPLLSENISMTEEKQLLLQIQQLPEQLKQEVLHYVEFLQKKYNAQNQVNKPKKRKAGSARGKYKLAPDFDAPLEDFKEYM